MRAQNAKTHGICRYELRVAQVRLERTFRQSMLAHHAPLGRKPAPERRGRGKIEHRERDEAGPPGEGRGDHASQRSSGKASDDRAAHVRRGGAPNPRRGPFLVDVRHRAREDPRRGQPLHEPPDDQLRQVGRRRRKRGGGCQRKRRADDDALKSDAIRQPAHERRRERDRHGRGGDRQADAETACAEGLRQKR